MSLTQVHTRKDRMDVCLDHLFHEGKLQLPWSDRNKPRHYGRNFYSYKPCLISEWYSGESILGIRLNSQTDVQTKVRNVKKRTSRIHSLRSQHQKNILHEVLGEAAFLIVRK